MIHDQPVEAVEEFKYLGNFFDCTLSFTANTEYIFKKAMQRSHLIRKLDSYNISKHILEAIYRSLVESVLTLNMCTWYGHRGRTTKGD